MKKAFYLFLFLLWAGKMFATGPSYIICDIRPISVNDRGDVLCRTKFLKNDMGAHWFMKTMFGLCILSEGKIIEYLTKTLDPEIINNDNISSDDYIALENHWNWIFKTPLDFNNLSGQQQQICEQYGFKENNAATYKVDQVLTISSFCEKRNLSKEKLKQYSLQKGYSTGYTYSDRLRILYDFGHILLLDNRFEENETQDTGASFSYINPLFEHGDSYEYHQIKGVLFLADKN